MTSLHEGKKLFQVFMQCLLPLIIEKDLHEKINVLCIINNVNKNDCYKSLGMILLNLYQLTKYSASLYSCNKKQNSCCILLVDTFTFLWVLLKFEWCTVLDSILISLHQLILQHSNASCPNSY